MDLKTWRQAVAELCQAGLTMLFFVMEKVKGPPLYLILKIQSYIFELSSVQLP